VSVDLKASLRQKSAVARDGPRSRAQNKRTMTYSSTVETGAASRSFGRVADLSSTPRPSALDSAVGCFAELAENRSVGSFEIGPRRR